MIGLLKQKSSLFVICSLENRFLYSNDSRSLLVSVDNDSTQWSYTHTRKLFLDRIALICANFKINFILKKCETFSVMIYSFINTSGNWKNEKLCGNDARRAECYHTISSFSNFHEYITNIAQRILTEEWREIFRVDIELYQHGS